MFFLLTKCLCLLFLDRLTAPRGLGSSCDWLSKRSVGATCPRAFILTDRRQLPPPPRTCTRGPFSNLSNPS